MLNDKEGKNMWLKIGVILSIILLFASCSEEQKQTVNEKIETFNIPWEKNLYSAFEKAKKEKKKIMVMAISKRCKWCNKIKKETLSNPKVLKKLNNYLLVKIDRDIPSQKSQIPLFEHVPAFFFATEEGKFYDELQGYFTTDEFLSAIKEIEELE